MIALDACAVCHSAAAETEKRRRGNGWNLLLTPLLPGTPATPGVVQKSSRRISRFEIIKHRIKRRNMSSATFARVTSSSSSSSSTQPTSHPPIPSSSRRFNLNATGKRRAAAVVDRTVGSFLSFSCVQFMVEGLIILHSFPLNSRQENMTVRRRGGKQHWRCSGTGGYGE